MECIRQPYCLPKLVQVIIEGLCRQRFIYLHRALEGLDGLAEYWLVQELSLPFDLDGANAELLIEEDVGYVIAMLFNDPFS
jgi:hypothetical protein